MSPDPTPAPQGPEGDARAPLPCVCGELESALAALSAEKEARAAELKTKRPALKSEAHWWYERCIAAEAARDAALADVERLRGALTATVRICDNHSLTIPLRARQLAALATTPEEPE